MPALTVEDFFRTKREPLQLELLNADAELARVIESATISSPGLVLAGYIPRYPGGRVQVLGETEVQYLSALSEPEARARLDAFLALDMPAVVVTKGQEVPTALLDAASARRVPLFRSQLKTGDFFRRLQPYLEEAFAPTTTMHGSLADVYGVGLLYVGRSGIGKSECVLDLVERGHRLVADDVVRITRRGNDILIGRALELQGHHMEIRGIGIVDIRVLFGVRAIRQQKRIEVVVQLEEWDTEATYNRTGLDVEYVEILGVQVPKVVVPLNPGKNITVISEVVAMDHLLRYSGTHSAALFDRRLREAMRPVRDYLEEDYE